MRFVLFFLFFLFLSYGPVILFSLGVSRECKSASFSKLIKVVLTVIPTMFISYYLCSLTGWVRLDMMFVCFFNIGMILFFLPLNVYMLCKVIYLYFRDKKGKTLRWISIFGAAFAAVIAMLLVRGIVDRKDVQVREISVAVDGLPSAFDGLKIVQITDAHIGNIDGVREYFKGIIEISNSYNPDIVMLTGDLINIDASEAEGTEGALNGFTANIGKYAVLGNHDYGKYYKWDSAQDSIDNLEAVKNIYRNFDFDLLLNENRVLASGEDTLVIAGMENCGEEPFPCYGDMDASLLGVEDKPVLLLSHDPSTWKTKVLDYKNVLMTFSGHTHAAQMGIEIADFKFSPAQYLYDEWDGLYEQDGRYLFVSRGVGYVGLAFRLGMRPEISVLTLVKK
ncbi:MAG: metallophosphoesterase [Paludibacteraceae bacterium]|nr:metallophosphoesterase [Paludibacteraceae bacterium]